MGYWAGPTPDGLPLRRLIPDKVDLTHNPIRTEHLLYNILLHSDSGVSLALLFWFPYPYFTIKTLYWGLSDYSISEKYLFSEGIRLGRDNKKEARAKVLASQLSLDYRARRSG